MCYGPKSPIPLVSYPLKKDEYHASIIKEGASQFVRCDPTTLTSEVLQLECIKIPWKTCCKIQGMYMGHG